jgi:hypothetical protein
VTSRADSHACAFLALAAALAPVASAQVVYSDSYPDNYPPALPGRKGPQPPPVILDWAGEVPLDGPLKSGPLLLAGESVVVMSESGAVEVEPREGGRLSLREAWDPEPEPDLFRWSEGPDGLYRCRADPGGGLVVEHRRRPSSRWREAWRRKTAAPVSAPPIVVGRRLLFASSDGRVTAARLSNGHLLWATDLGERLSRAAVLWNGSPGGAGPDEEVALLLVIPDSGTALLALDVYDGRVVARGSVPGERGRLVSPPLVLADGRIAAARQGYALEDAGLGTYRIRRAEERSVPDPADPVPYNAAPELDESPPARR